MRFFNLSPENQQRLAVLVPIIALFLSLFVVYPGVGQYRELDEKIERQKAELASLKSSQLAPPGNVAPAADDLPSETPQFLGQLNILANLAQCRVVGFEALTTDKPKTDAGGQASTAIRPVRARIELDAPYQQVRNFLGLIAQAPRLYVVTDVKLKAEDKTNLKLRSEIVQGSGLRATLEIERYVASPTPATPRPG